MKPINNIPSADTLTTLQNSSFVGFFVIFKTLIHSFMNLFNLFVFGMIFKREQEEFLNFSKMNLLKAKNNFVLFPYN